jgi:glyoxylase-like metal-dependent hydrolase (beta-lactamase superfamily II)/rhodanese-related sulfurtransferase
MTVAEKMTITPAELKRMIDTGEEFTLLDVRNDDEFARWRIEGRHTPPTVHIPYFVAIEDPDAFLSQVERQVPKDKLVVAVCAKGDSSAWVAEEFLRPKGYRVVNLEGGMIAWGSYYDAHEVPESADDVVRVIQLERTARGCLHYIVNYDGDKAIVIDPPRHFERVLEITQQNGWRITHIFDTHAHADHISGGLPLSRVTGAPYFLHPYDAIHPIDVLPATFEFEWLKDGMTFKLGEATLKVIHIPGHTLGNVAYLLEGKRRYLFTGDSIFIVSIARPDLGGRGETWSPMWYDTLTKKLLTLPDDVLVLPGHFSQHKEARTDGVFAATLGELKETNEDLRRAMTGSKDEFVAWMLANLPEFPPQYVDIKRVNAGLLHPDEEKANELELGKNICALATAYQ